MLTPERCYGYDQKSSCDRLVSMLGADDPIFKPENRVDFRTDGIILRWFDLDTMQHDWCVIHSHPVGAI